jgi:hypothetical protein
MVVIVGSIGTAVWLSTKPAYERGGCRGVAASSMVAPTPARAFDAWWQARGHRAGRNLASSNDPSIRVDPAARDDFQQVSNDEWEWRYSRDGSVVVNINRTDDRTAWQVASVGRCGWQPA